MERDRTRRKEREMAVAIYLCPYLAPYILFLAVTPRVYPMPEKVLDPNSHNNSFIRDPFDITEFSVKSFLLCSPLTVI